MRYAQSKVCCEQLGCSSVGEMGVAGLGMGVGMGLTADAELSDKLAAREFFLEYPSGLKSLCMLRQLGDTGINIFGLLVLRGPINVSRTGSNIMECRSPRIITLTIHLKNDLYR